MHVFTGTCITLGPYRHLLKGHNVMESLKVLTHTELLQECLHSCFLFLPKLLFQMIQTLLEAIQILEGPVLIEDTTRNFSIDY